MYVYTYLCVCVFFVSIPNRPGIDQKTKVYKSNQVQIDLEAPALSIGWEPSANGWPELHKVETPRNEWQRHGDFINNSTWNTSTVACCTSVLSVPDSI